MLYRREIDGLRAVAVMPVILFHAGFSVFSGGFVGVDVFFVISGYLITTIIVSERRAETFSILSFYERRARRILPALFTVVAFAFPFAWLWMTPEQFSDFGRSIAATALFISNVHFWEHTGYFAQDAELQPLLHTWSLAVEEQYYLIFPLLLLLLGRFHRQRFLFVISIMAIASLSVSEWGWRNEPDANFFFTFSRFWELLAGSLCAIVILDRGPWKNETLSLLGLTLIIFAIFYYDDTVPFPSVWALAPVGGTVLIILYGRSGTLVARLLSMRGFVGIGLISYSAYLWHQPIFAFARIRSFHEPDQSLMMALSVLALALAALCWRFVEQPFRRRPIPLLPGRTRLLAVSAVSTVGVFVIGLSVFFKSDVFLPWNFDQRILQASQDRNDRLSQCLPAYDEFDWKTAALECSDIAHPDWPNVALIGDSHADQFARAIREYPSRNFNFYQFTVNSCPPFMGFHAENRSCDDYARDLAVALDELAIDVVIISARWISYATTERFDNGEGGIERAPVHPFRHSEAGSNDRSFTSALVRRFVRGIEQYLDIGFKVVLLQPVPEAGWNVPDLTYKIAQFEGLSLTDIRISTSRDRFEERNKAVTSVFNKLLHDNLVQVRPGDILCDSFIPDRCANVVGGQILYYDDDHLSTIGAALVVPEIAEAIYRLNIK